MRHKKAKLQNRNALLRSLPENQDKPQIFRGVVATVNGYTKPSLQDLTEMVVTHGGIFVQYMDGKTAVTHIIASALTPKKMVELASYRVVKPCWVVECIKEGKLLPWEPWRVISEGVGQSKLVFTSSQATSTPGCPGTLGLVRRMPRRTTASYKDVVMPGKSTPQPTLGRIRSQGSVTPSPSSPKWSTQDSKPFTPSQSDIPDGKSFAVVIPRSRSTTPYNQPKPPSTQDTIFVKWKLPPNLSDEQCTGFSPPVQDLSSVLDSVPEDTPPSHQPQLSIDEEIPDSSPFMSLSPPHRPGKSSTLEPVDEIPGSSPQFNFEADDESFILSSEGGETGASLHTLDSTKEPWSGRDSDYEQLLSPQLVKVSSDESYRVLRHRTVTEEEIPPTSPIGNIGNIDMSHDISGEISEIMTKTSTPPTQEEHPQSKQENRPAPKILNKKRPLISATLPSPSSKRQKGSTLEEANTSFLANPRIRNATVLNPDFLKQYYQESRLHHLSSWKAELKQKLQDLIHISNRRTLGSKMKTKHASRYILHVDFDCFFAAVSTRNHPMDLTGKPVVVTHGTGGEKNVTSEIASCNYRARESGVKNGMWMKRALELCPNIVCLPYDFPAYEKASNDFYAVMLDIGADVVQSVSVDEALMDVTSICCATGDGDVNKEQAQADYLASIIRNRVREKTSCEVSVGIGGNILLAKLALRKAKPAGQYHIKTEEALDFLSELDIQHLPGVGSSLSGRLAEELQITKVTELRTTSRERLRTVVGTKTGDKLWNFAHGIDHVEVGDIPERKSVGVDVSWGVRFETHTQVEEFLHSLAEELHRRLVEAKVKGKQVTVKVMKRAKDAPVITPKFLGSGVCDIYTKSVALGIATWDPDILASESSAIVRAYRFPPTELRGLGLQMTKLEKAEDAFGTRGQRTLDFKSASVVKEEEERVEEQYEEPGKVKKVEKIKNEREGKEEKKPPPVVASRKSMSPVAGPWAFIPPGALHLQASEQPPMSPDSQSPLLSPFLVPSVSQIDPSVLDALPSTMRAGVLAAASKKRSPHDPQFKPISPRPPLSRKKLPLPEPRAGPPKPRLQPQTPLPPQIQPQPPLPLRNNDLIPPSLSQIDPEFLASLTPELREEILREYRSAASTVPSSPPRRHPLMSPRKGRGKGKEKQTRLPQSPRKSRGWTGVAGWGSPSKTLLPTLGMSGGSSTRGGMRGRSGSPNSADELSGIQAQYCNIQPQKLFPQQQQQQRHIIAPNTPFPPPSYGSSRMSAKAVVTYTPIPRNPTAPRSTHVHSSAKTPLKLAKVTPSASASASTSTTTAHLQGLPADLPPDLDRTVLASLPPDILTEILTHHCRKPQSNSSPLFQLHQLPKPPNPLLPAPSTRCLHLPTLPRPPLRQRPHLQQVSTLPELRSLLESWVVTSTPCGSDAQEGGDDQGPNEEDVDVLVQYLRQVVVVERDMEKAKKVVEWFAEVVAELDGADVAGGANTAAGTCCLRWQRAVERAAVDGVGAGCRERGVPEFEWEFAWGDVQGVRCGGEVSAGGGGGKGNGDS